MPALDEKQIQEKLYGQYRKGTIPAASKTDSVQLIPALESQPKPVQNMWVPAFKSGWSRFALTVIRFFKPIPWPALSIVLISFVASAVLFQAVLFLVEKVRTIDWNASKRMTAVSFVETEKSLVLPPVQTSPSVKAKLSGAASGVVNSPAIPQTSSTSQISAAKPKRYAVQVCTYEREEDAVQLVQRLNQLNFVPFYRKTISRQQKVFYLVFLGSAATYEEARLQLSAFKKTQTSQQFRDAFVRSI